MPTAGTVDAVVAAGTGADVTTPPPHRGPDAPPRVGLVLGAGGTAGVAYHAGTLLALEQDLGWDPRDADVIVGTSAGSIVASLLRAGLSTDDLAAWGTRAAPLDDRRELRRTLDRIDDVGMRFVRPRLRARLPGPGWLLAVAGPSGFRPHTGFMSLLPHGPIDAATALRETHGLHDGWPRRELLVNAVRVSDARRIVFGRDEIVDAVGVADAVAASCAIPGVFRPVRIGRHWYIDGGAHSPTNADVLRDRGVDVAVVLSPMSIDTSTVPVRPEHALRALYRRRLRREVAELTAAGIDVEIFEPGPSTLRAMGWNALDRARSARIVTDAFLSADVGRYAHEPNDSVLNRLRRVLTPVAQAS